MTAVLRRSGVPRPARFERPRTPLLGVLSDALDVPLVVLSAPTGYGKTTLLAQYARFTPRRVAWVRVTDEHEGPVSLLSRLAATLPELAPLAHADPRTPPGTLLHQLGALLSSVDDGLDLIVDNVSSEAQRTWLAQLADLLEEGHRLLISTYSTDGLRLARRLADGLAVVLDAADLAFTEAEVTAYLQERGGPLSAGDLAHLGGWPAGLALAASGSSRHAVAEDLVLDALATLPAGLAGQLSALAPLDVWTEADAALVAPDLPAGWLLAVQRAGLPVLALGQGAFRPHGLLVSVLETQLRRAPDAARRAQGQAARLAEARGDAERAAALYLQAQEPEAALRVATPLVSVYRDRGELHRTRALLEAFGTHLSPALRERLAWAQIETGAPAQGGATLEALHAAGQLSASGLASLAMLRGRQGDTAQQYALSREGLALDGPLTPALFWPFVQAALRLGHFEEAEAKAARLRRWALRDQDAVRQAEAWHLQALVWRQTRPPQEAAQALAHAREAYESLGWQGRAATLHLDELELAVRAGTWPEDTALTLGALEGRLPPEMPVLHLRRLNLLGAVQARLGQAAAAERTLRSALALAREAGVHLGSSGLSLTLADALLAQGRPAEALDWLQEEPAGGSSLLRTLLVAQATGQPCAFTEAELQAEPDVYVRERARAASGALRPDVKAPVTATSTAGPLTFPLRVVTLGDCRATLNGQPVKLGLAKARELLAWLALHPSGSRDELVTALWDGSAEDRHVEYFRVTVRRLRSALREHVPEGLDPLPYADGRYRLSDHLTVSVDALDPPGPAALQPFLPGVDTEWADVYRQGHTRRVSQALLEQAAATPPAEAIEAYQALLHLDPLLGDAHEGLIRTLHRQGDAARLTLALSTYERLLRAEYGADLPDALRQLRPA
ncbi:hypothetical protein [Deinococcus radiotolerans]|uniref:Transcriptional activator domain n=1 Tax=Deinococcus radiotolerans TaxID=1309407 RepID=A0ABQ2FIZ1_9DEIO|nr:hypothetical protein [Deinococcus radiotolerans]GGL02199.1 hypothetical protein GCM10010844_20910 [Deinococcus radiotolerans]